MCLQQCTSGPNMRMKLPRSSLLQAQQWMMSTGRWLRYARSSFYITATKPSPARLVLYLMLHPTCILKIVMRGKIRSIMDSLLKYRIHKERKEGWLEAAWDCWLNGKKKGGWKYIYIHICCVSKVLVLFGMCLYWTLLIVIIISFFRFKFKQVWKLFPPSFISPE